MELTQAQLEAIVELYIAYFNRAPETAGLDFHVAAVKADIAAGLSFEDALDNRADNFFEAAVSMPEQTGYSISQPTSDFVRTIYENTLLRPGAGGEAPTDAEVGYWVAQLESGAVSRGEMISQFISDTKFLATNGTPEEQAIASEVVAVLENRVEVGLYFSHPEVSGGLTGEAAYEAGVAALAGVDETQESVDAAIDRLEDGAIEGNTIALTTGVDVLDGTAENDTFVGTISNNGLIDNSTFQSGDTINGGAGEDTLRVTATANVLGGGGGGGFPALATPFLTGVEHIETTALAAVAAYDLGSSEGVESFALVNSTSGIAAALNVTEMVDVSIENYRDLGLGGGFGGGGVAVVYDTAVTAGTEDVQNISLDEAGSLIGISGGPEVANISVGGVETFDITAMGENNVSLNGGGFGLGNDDLDTVNIAGAGMVNIANTLDISTLDASENTGGVSAIFDTGADVAATGGSGDDNFDFGSGLDADDAVDGGEGFDTVFVDGDDFSLAADVAPLNGLANAERIEFGGTTNVVLNGATFDNAAVEEIGIDTDSATADALNNAAADVSYEFGTANSGDATFNMAGGATTLNLALNGTDPTAAAGDGDFAEVGDVMINLSGTAAPGTTMVVNLTSEGDLAAGDFNVTGEVNVAAGSTVNVDGSGNLEIASFANAVTVDASALAGNLVIEGSKADDADISGGIDDGEATGVDMFTLGQGQNTVTFSDALDSGAVDDTTGSATDALLFDTINGFTAGDEGDVLDSLIVAGDADYTAVDAGTQASIDGLSGVGATDLVAANEAAAFVATVDAWTAYSFQGETYAYYDGDGNGTFDQGADMIVHLAGVNVADLTDANFA